MDQPGQNQGAPPPPLVLGPLTPGQEIARNAIVGGAVVSVIWFLIGAPGADRIADYFGWGQEGGDEGELEIGE